MRPAELIVRAVAGGPAGIKVDVDKTMVGKAAFLHRVRLRGDVLLIHHRAGGDDGLLAESAPAEIGALAYAVELSGGGNGQSEQSGESQCEKISHCRFFMAYAAFAEEYRQHKVHLVEDVCFSLSLACAFKGAGARVIGFI